MLKLSKCKQCVCTKDYEVNKLYEEEMVDFKMKVLMIQNGNLRINLNSSTYPSSLDVHLFSLADNSVCLISLFTLFN